MLVEKETIYLHDRNLKAEIGRAEETQGEKGNVSRARGRERGSEREMQRDNNGQLPEIILKFITPH